MCSDDFVISKRFCIFTKSNDMKVFNDNELGALQLIVGGHQYSMEYDRYCDSLFLWRDELQKNNKVLHVEISIDDCGMLDKFENSGMNTMTIDTMSDGSYGGHTTYERGVSIEDVSIPLFWYKEVIDKYRVNNRWKHNVERTEYVG